MTSDEIIPVEIDKLRALYLRHQRSEPPTHEDWYRFLAELKRLSLVKVTELSVHGRHQ